MYNTNKINEDEYISIILLVTLISIAILIAYYRILIQIEIGPIWDTFDFLSNAMYFAGYGFGYSDLTRPPILPLLTSIFFRFGLISEISIFIADGLFYVLGILSFYFLLRMRFNSIESFLGSLIFATFPSVLFFTALGLSDIPSLSFSILAIYFTILAVKRNSKLFYISFLMIVFAFLTRYSAALIVFPIILYLIMNKRLLNYRDVFLGILISSIPLIFTLIFFFYTYENPFYPFISFYGSTQGVILPVLNYYYFPDFFYFIKNIPSYIGVPGITITAFIVFGILMLLIKRIKFNYSNHIKNSTFKNRFNKINVIFLILLFICLISLNKIPWILSEVIFLVAMILLYTYLKEMEFNYLEMDLLFVTWFMVFFLFHSIYVIKDDRYFLTMAPALSYFLILGFSKISKSFQLKKNLKFAPQFVAIFLAVIMLLSAFLYLPGISENEILEKEAVNDSKSSSEWLINHDPTYKSKIIYADLAPYFSWYLKMNVKNMPVFMNDQTYGYQIKNYNITDKDMQTYNNELVNNNATYYFSIRSGMNLTNYQLLIRFGIISLYGRI